MRNGSKKLRSFPHLPPISPICDYTSTNPGSLDLSELNKRLPNKMTQSFAYSEIANLSESIETLKKENDKLKQQLCNQQKNHNSFNETDESHLSTGLQLEQRLLTLSERLKERDREINALFKSITFKHEPKMKVKPNFIETNHTKSSKTIMGKSSSPFILSNDQLTFFKADDIERQNQQLKEMISTTENDVHYIKTRQSLYETMQHDNRVSSVMSHLNEGRTPNKLIDTAPDQLDELDITIQLLQNELKSLIRKKKHLIDERRTKKFNLRKYRLQFRSALKIQKVVRGYFARQAFIKQKKAAILIQKIFKGYYTRHKLKIIEPFTPTEHLINTPQSESNDSKSSEGFSDQNLASGSSSDISLNQKNSFSHDSQIDIPPIRIPGSGH